MSADNNPPCQLQEEEIFARAIEIDGRDERSQFLDAACGGDAELRSRLDKLLNEFDHPRGFFDQPDRALKSIELEPTKPETVGGFEIIREIGRGGMGIVYEARQASLNRRVALKVLSVGLQFSKKSIVRFQREAEAAAKLHHTNIVPIYTTGIQSEIPYYAMELVEGPSLDQILIQLRTDRADGADDMPSADSSSGDVVFKDEVIAANERSTQCSLQADTLLQSSTFESGSGIDYFDAVARVVADIADALEHAHREGVIHRDIKPSNLLMSPDGRVSISDFGLARVLEEPGLTMTGELMGSPQYMSPEQARGIAVDHRADLFSLGSVIFAMACGRPPFRAETPYGILRKITDEPHRPLSQVRSDTPPWLESIIDRLLAKEPSDRFQSANEVASILEDCLAHLRQPTTTLLPKIESVNRRRFGNRLLAAAVSILLVIGAIYAISKMISHPVTTDRPSQTESQTNSQTEIDSAGASGAVETTPGHLRWEYDDSSLQRLETDLRILLEDTQILDAPEGAPPVEPYPVSE